MYQTGGDWEFQRKSGQTMSEHYYGFISGKFY